MPQPDHQAESNDGAAVGAGLPLAPIALATAVLAVPAAIIGGLIFAVLPGSFLIGVLLGIVAAIVAVVIRLRSADRVVMSSIEGGLPSSVAVERLANLIQSLSLAAGVDQPEVLVVPDGARNAMVASCRGRNHLAVTSGLLDHIDVIQMEGVVAELLVRLKSGDAEAATIGAALFGRPMIDGPLSAVLSPIGERGLAMLLAPDRDLTADRHAVSLTRYPPGLLAALQTMSQGDLAPSASTDGVAHVWLVDPGERNDRPAARSDIDLRIDILAEY